MPTPATPFNEQFDQHGAWRREFALRLKLLSEWLRSHELMDAAAEEQLHRLESQMRSDKVTVAFVAEFSRGKSELINAIFFAGYGRRIMPASAGRTTMCPTELAYEPGVTTSLRLLPIDTRLQPQGLAEWRLLPREWTQIELNVQDPEQLAQVLGKVAEVRRVSKEQARALGFWHDEVPDENPHVDAQGMVEVPQWRHALINIPHPLLKQGLVILDTPGLNAIGAEPELTVSLIPQAQAVVFILGADTGVTRSDLAIWREHLSTPVGGAEGRIVVLNKIDTLWDALSTPQQIHAQIQRQRSISAEMLGVSADQVIAVSAQKGLVAKINRDDALLEMSALPRLEEVLAQGIMGRRQSILRTAVSNRITDLRTGTSRNIHARRRELSEQILELRSLRGKNVAVIGNMRARIEQEQREFDLSTAKITAVRSVQLRMVRDIFQTLGNSNLKREMGSLAQALRQRGLKLGARRAYGEAFTRLRSNLAKAQSTCSEIQVMLAATFRQLNAEYGFSLQPPAESDLSRYQVELDRVEESHTQYLTIGNMLRLAQPEFAERLIRALLTRLRTVYEGALTELELWSRASTAQLDTQIKERTRSFERRIDAIDRIQGAASDLGSRLEEIERAERALKVLELKLQDLTGYFVQPAPAAADLPRIASPAAAYLSTARKAA